MKYLPWIIVFFLALALLYTAVPDDTATQRTAESTAVHSSSPTGDAIPDASGGMYILGVDELWYARGTRLHRVEGVDSYILDLVPTADGSAYAVTFDGLWRLDGATAEPVEKSDGGFTPLSQLAAKDSPYFVLWQYERRRHAGLDDAAPLLGPDPAEDPN